MKMNTMIKIVDQKIKKCSALNEKIKDENEN